MRHPAGSCHPDRNMVARVFTIKGWRAEKRSVPARVLILTLVVETMKNFSITGTYTDLYQLTMGQVYYLKGMSNKQAVFDYFFRKIPFEGGYVVFAGLGD